MPSRFGEGHNYSVEVGFLKPHVAGEEVRLRAALDAVLVAMDHRALGVDVDLGVEPETPQLAEWIAKKLTDAQGASVREVRLIRGDGMTATYFAQPSDGRSIVPPPDFVKG